MPVMTYPLDKADARCGLQTAFGNQIIIWAVLKPVTATNKEENRRMRILWQDLLYGCRMLLKKPALTIVAALSLGLGIGANTVIFSLINTTLLRPLPFKDPAQLMVIWTVPLQDRTQQNSPNYSVYSTMRDRVQTIESIGAITNSIKNLGADKGGVPAERISGWGFSPKVFEALGVK